MSYYHLKALDLLIFWILQLCSPTRQSSHLNLDFLAGMMKVQPYATEVQISCTIDQIKSLGNPAFRFSTLPTIVLTYHGNWILTIPKLASN